jgi:hypothetical protein
MQVCADPVPAVVPAIGACGQPTINYLVDGALFVWKDCDADNWHVRASSAAGYVKYNGTITSDQPLKNITPFSLESSDILDNSSGTEIVFGMGVSNPAADGFDFSAACSSNTTLKLASPKTGTVLVGADRDIAATEVTISQLSACTAP